MTTRTKDIYAQCMKGFKSLQNIRMGEQGRKIWEGPIHFTQTKRILTSVWIHLDT